MSDISERDLLIRIDTRVQDLHDIIKGTEAEPGLRTRVENVEKTVERAKGWWAGIVTIVGTAWAGLEFYFHKK